MKIGAPMLTRVLFIGSYHFDRTVLRRRFILFL
jgi:hypothetical protein